MPTQFEVVIADITRFEADAIVNAANTTLLGGVGVDGAIHKAAGPELNDCCRQLGGCPTGCAKITPAFNIQTARYIIHTPGPVFSEENADECDRLLANCYTNSLRLAEQYDCRTIAFPAISTGRYMFPVDRAAGVVAKVFRDYYGPLERVTMCCFDPTTEAAYRRAFADIGIL